MKLGEILDYKKGRAPTSSKTASEHIIYLSPEYLRGKSLPTYVSDFIGKVEVDDNDLLLLWDGSNAGEFFLGKEGVLSSTMVKLLFNEDTYDKPFLYYQLKSAEDFLKSQTNGSGIPHVDKEVFLSINVEHFEPEEQRQIAAILSKVDQAIEQTEQLIAKYRRIKTGLMQDLLTRGIDEHGHIRSEATHPFKDSPLGRIPEEWEVKNLENLLSDVPNNMRSGPFGSSLTKSEWVNTGVPYLGIDNVHRELFVKDYKRFVTNEKFRQLEKYAVRPKDVMITIMGTVGRSCVVPENVGDALSSKHVWTMSFSMDEYIPELVCYQLNYAPWILSVFNTESQGGIMQSINSTILRHLLLPKPSIEEQNAILNKLVSQNNYIKIEQAKLTKLQSLKTGLMQDLLSGKVRANHLVSEPVGV